ncbi:hypothetical protein DIS24_g4686 [Lasiodiplodia hormozganensis]|uniref:Uncharacterized protein n=1 Tax=Lasiodiplodia hormozganensis TaxID=869390 RepID=A0AA39YTH2_9PEZI|nr:hypothetical protein DIS24_g4686 [Lasiodiplodia hormozganensis]
MPPGAEVVSDGASSDFPLSDLTEVDSPTPPAKGDTAEEPTCGFPTANTHTDHDYMSEPIMDPQPEKPPMPAWLTDPAGRAEITLAPSVDKHHPAHPAVARRQQQADHLLPLQYTGLPSNPVPDERTANDSGIQDARGNYEQNAGGNGNISAGTPQHKQPALPDKITTVAQATQTSQHAQQSDAVYVVLIQYQPLVEYGGSQFDFCIHDQYPKVNGFSTIEHYTKAFRLSRDAKTYALKLFTQRITLDYRYVMQKAWDDLSLEEIRAYGVTEDGPSPHIRGFKLSSIDEPFHWQVRFGCDEEFCRISVIPVRSGDRRLQDMPFVEAGQPYGGMSKSLKPPNNSDKTPVGAKDTDRADGTASAETTTCVEQLPPAEGTVSKESAASNDS